MMKQTAKQKRLGLNTEDGGCALAQIITQGLYCRIPLAGRRTINTQRLLVSAVECLRRGYRRWKAKTNTILRAPVYLGPRLGEVFKFMKLGWEHERQTDQSILHPHAQRLLGNTDKDVIWVRAWYEIPKLRQNEIPNCVKADRQLGKVGNNHFIRFTSVSIDYGGYKTTGGQAMEFKDITLLGPWTGGSEDQVKWMVTQLLLEIKTSQGKHNSKEDNKISDNSDIKEVSEWLHDPRSWISISGGSVVVRFLFLWKIRRNFHSPSYPIRPLTHL